MEYYSAAKKNKIMTFPGKWMDLRNITNSEKKKKTPLMFTLLCGS